MTVPEISRCDFCGRSELELPSPLPEDAPRLQIDPDGLWVCAGCRARLVTAPVGDVDAAELCAEIEALVGQSAGAICSVLNLPYVPPYRAVIDAANQIAYAEDRYMSAWSFVTQWLDGSTVWQNEDGSATAIVSADGSVRVSPR